MANPKIFIRRSATPNKVPTSDQLALGELAINTNDGKLYLEKDPNGVGIGTTVVCVNPFNVGVGSLSYDINFTAGDVGIGTDDVSTAVGSNNTAVLAAGIVTAYKFYGDGSALTGVSASSGIGTVGMSTSPPSSPSPGSLWWDTDIGELYVYYNDGDSAQWVETSGGSETVTVSDNAPSSPNGGDLWWESDTGRLKIYYNDGDSAQWIDANGGLLSGFSTSIISANTINVSGVSTFVDKVNIGQATDVDHTLCVAGTDNTTSLTTNSHSQGIQLQNKSTTDGTYSQIEWRTAGGYRYARIAGIQDDADGNGGQLVFLSRNSSGTTFEGLRIHSNGVGEFKFGAITRKLIADDATPSGTSQSYINIPSWATKITILFDRISLTGGSEILVQLGTSGGAITSNYQSSTQTGSAGQTETSTEGFIILNTSSSHTHTGSMVIERMGTSSKWISHHHLSIATGAIRVGNGVLTTYSGTIDRVILTTEGGSQTFDGGTITIYCEA